ncbi:MAG TPA: hypothetical protein VHO28_06335 [Ignavibacteriales bacterium]|nr:hypothetical protein [Ignavibacteriales bacterium]HEX3073118.1 hypothetical protein [Ignavibacteriales bacterium]
MKSIIVLLLIPFVVVFSQNDYWNHLTLTDSTQNVEFSIKYENKVYKAETDTIDLLFTVKNYADTALYIFDPEYLYNGVKNFSDLNNGLLYYEYDLGGIWFYNPGYITFMMLKEIPPHFIFNYHFRLSFDSIDIKKHEANPAYDNMYPDAIREEFISFYIAYILKTSKCKVSFDPQTQYWDFETTHDAIYFESNLSRISLGPVSIYYKR